MSDLKAKVITATKWSSITEIAAKLVTPISTMVLARLLSPEAFGVMVTAVMVISFSEIFADAGFQKYLIQYPFKSVQDLYKSTTVAFWSNLIVSLFLWGIIIVFSKSIATFIGNEGYGDVISVSCVCIPLSAFSSIQMALYKRDFNFKTLFTVRIVGVCIPLIITIPLAYFTRSYWALIVGMIALNLSNALLLTVKSKWKPSFYFSFPLLKKMFSFTVWSMFEAVSIWLTGYIDVFIVGAALNQHYLGIYRTSTAMVGQITGIITTATTPILFSLLSRLQDDTLEFKRVFLKFQKIVGLLVLPIGVGLFWFRGFITEILLGSQWYEASYFIGIWGLSSAFTIILAHYCSEVYRAKGKPQVSVLIQVSHLLFLVPIILWSVQFGFDFLCEMRSLIRIELIIANLFMLNWLFKISIRDITINILPSIIATLAMIFALFLLPEVDSDILVNILFILLAILVYTSILLLFFPIERNILLNLKQILKK
ncbi:lipopolysaccharide biosynthesis protein [Bacteroides sp.]|uniref:lipopolysaccharide biosynthesis protein n=1 Tax=Bacteroides sp. TaxID=29523 RepID=UPI0025894F88|nr:lipopolysaccharide biosynthesis protein [Bacteroides sp.]